MSVPLSQIGLQTTALRDNMRIFTLGGESIATSFGANCTAVAGRESILLVDPLIAPVYARRIETAMRSWTQVPVAAAVFAGTHLALAVVFNMLWLYASGKGRLLGSCADPREVRAITRQYRFGPIFCTVAFVLAFFSVAASVGLCLLLALFFALTGALTRVFGDRPPATEISS